VTIPRTPDVLVIGGGVIGCAIARELAATRRVLLVDRGPIGGEASSAAAGVLSVASGTDDDERLVLRKASLALFPDLADALRAETDVDVGLARPGVVTLAGTDMDAAAGVKRVAQRRSEGFRAELLDAREVTSLEPAANPALRGGVLFPDDASIVAERFVTALADSARRRGATLVPGAPVLDVERDGGRVARVRVGHEWITPSCVVLATGAWGASAIAGLDVGIDLVPVRGQMIALRPPRGLGHVLTIGDAFLVPRAHGIVWVGATFEEVGFDKTVTAAGLSTLATHVERVAPTMLDVPIVHAWAGLRPFCRRGGPILGRPPGLDNVLVALGHHRNGILLTPLTAAAIRACADGVPPPLETTPFLLG
jgi:glycine oxidase